MESLKLLSWGCPNIALSIGISCCQKKRRGRRGQIVKGLFFSKETGLFSKITLFCRENGLFSKTTLFCRENGLLKETKSELEHAIAETERPLRYLNKSKKYNFLDFL